MTPNDLSLRLTRIADYAQEPLNRSDRDLLRAAAGAIAPTEREDTERKAADLDRRLAVLKSAAA